MSSIALFFLSPLLKYLTFSVVVGGGCIAAFLFLPFPSRTRAIIGIVGAVILGTGPAYWYAFHQGEAHMARRIAAKDAEAIKRVEDALKEVDECGAENWDVTTGTCGGLR